MRWAFALLLILFGSLTAAKFEELPVAHKGRYRPLDTYARMLLPKEEKNALPKLWKAHFERQSALFQLLPSRYKKGEWISLSALKYETKNFTLYPDALFEEIKQTYHALEKEPTQKELLQKFADLLDEGYTNLARTPYLSSHTKTLHYPAKWQLKLERLYFQLPLLAICMMGYFLAFLLYVLGRNGFWLYVLTFALHTGILLFRCAILERPPVSNMYETVIYVPWIAATSAFFLRKRTAFVASSFAAFFLLALLKWSALSTEMENVQPVLDSRTWLIIHVLMVVGSYGVFVLSGALAHIYLFQNMRGHENKALAMSILQTLYLGVSLLIPGTILGGVWAAQSWGRFWDWDPKESWAFISSCLYLISIHAYTFGKIKERGLAIGAIVGLQSITFTWYGVNYILGTGLHSYGFGTGGEVYYFAFVALELLFILLNFILPRGILKPR